MGKRVFVSYSRKDAEVVTSLVGDVVAMQNEAWQDLQLAGGQKWWDEVLNHIESCDVFLVAISEHWLDSEACRAEHRFALACQKPVLPVTISAGLSDALVPPELAALQRVNYVEPDRRAAISLAAAIAGLPPAAPVTGSPARPGVPGTYVSDLRDEIESATPLDLVTQNQILGQLRGRLDDGVDPAVIRQLLERFRRRDDLYAKVAEQINDALAQLGGTPAPTVRAAMPPPTQPLADAPVAPLAAAPHPPPQYVAAAPAAPTGRVSGAWWLAPIFFGLIGGLIAWAVVKATDSRVARNMLIVGVVSSFVWFAIVASQGTSGSP
jgi:hypothetical protein